MKFIFILFFFFVTIFNLKVAIPPYSLLFATGGVGVLCLLHLLFKNGYNLNEFHACFIILSIFSFISLLISMLINHIFDFFYLKEIILFSLFSYFSALASVYLIKNKIENNDAFLIYLFIGLVVFQLIISFICYLSPKLFDLIFGVFSRPDIDDKILGFNEMRLVGLGASFFGSGIINSFTLILIASILKKKQSNITLLWLMLSFVIVLVIGLMSSRSTIIGALIAIFLILSNFNSFLRYFKLMVIISPLLYLGLNLIPENDRLKEIFNFGFQFVFNFEDSQASKSTGELKEMWKIIPDNLKTWFFGDVYFRSEGGGYYMNTDVGYFRLIYSVGFFGLFFFFLMNILMIFKIKNKFFGLYEKLGLIFLFLILNVKGVSNLIPLLSIFYISSIYRK